MLPCDCVLSSAAARFWYGSGGLRTCGQNPFAVGHFANSDKSLRGWISRPEQYPGLAGGRLSRLESTSRAFQRAENSIPVAVSEKHCWKWSYCRENSSVAHDVTSMAAVSARTLCTSLHSCRQRMGWIIHTPPSALSKNCKTLVDLANLHHYTQAGCRKPNLLLAMNRLPELSCLCQRELLNVTTNDWDSTADLRGIGIGRRSG
jgi:hypothetical protein